MPTRGVRQGRQAGIWHDAEFLKIEGPSRRYFPTQTQLVLSERQFRVFSWKKDPCVGPEPDFMCPWLGRAMKHETQAFFRRKETTIVLP